MKITWQLIIFCLLITISFTKCKKKVEVKSEHVSSLNYKYIKGSWADKVKCVDRTLDGGFIYAGYNEVNNNADAFMMKVDSAGNKLWYKSFGGYKLDAFNYVIATYDGGFVGIGFTNSKGFDTLNSKKSQYVVKVDANGNLLWEKTYANIESDLHGGFELSNHQILLTGYCNKSNADFILAKIDENGKELINRSYSNVNITPLFITKNWNEYGVGLNEKDDGTIIIGGLMSKSNYVSEVANLITFSATTSSNGLLKTFYPNYDYVRNTNYWAYTINGRLIRTFSNVKILKLSDGFLFATYIEDMDGIMKIVLHKTDESADLNNPVWTKTYTGLGNAILNDIVDMGDGTLMISGSSSKNNLDLAFPEFFNGLQTLVMKIDMNGNEIWSSYEGANENAYVGSCIQKLSNGGYALAGYSSNNDIGYHAMIWMELDKNGKLVK